MKKFDRRLQNLESKLRHSEKEIIVMALMPGKDDREAMMTILKEQYTALGHVESVFRWILLIGPENSEPKIINVTERNT